MIKAHYGPATEDLVKQIVSGLIDADIEAGIAEKVIDLVKEAGYDITIEVEVHGDMARALESLDKPEEYIARMRPVRQIKT